MSYPLESERAITFAMQWSLLNIGAALGGLITLIQTLKSGNAEAVGTGTYVAFIVIVLVSPPLHAMNMSDIDDRSELQVQQL